MSIRYIGVDFGTSTSVVAYMDYEMDPDTGRLKPLSPYPMLVQFDTTSYAPTAVQLAGSVNGKFSEEKYGWKALNNSPFHSLLRLNFKMSLLSANHLEEAKELTEKFFQYLYETYTSATLNAHGTSPAQVITCVSHPAKWPAELQALTLEAAQKAGFPNVRPKDEAEAAMQFMLSFDSATKRGFVERYSGRQIHVMILDMGAGTTDVAIYRYTLSGSFGHELLASYPKDGEINFGGREVDALLCDFYMQQLGEAFVSALGKGDAALGMLELMNAIKPYKENTLSPQLAENHTIDAEPPAVMYYAYNNSIEGDRALDRRRFEAIADNYLPMLPKLVQGALNEAGLQGDAIELVVLTGGHSQWYFVEEMLQGSVFPGCETINLPLVKQDPWRLFKPADPQHVVAKGLAMLGLERSQQTGINVEQPVYVYTKEEQIIHHALIASYRKIRRLHSRADIDTLKKEIVETAMLLNFHPRHFKSDSDQIVDNIMSYGKYLFHAGKTIANGSKLAKVTLETAFENSKKFLDEIHPYTEDNETTIFVTQTYLDVRTEYSNESEDSYEYSYCIPKMFKLSTGGEFWMNGDYKNCPDFVEITNGISIKYTDSHGWKERTRRYEIKIHEDVCPVRIQYNRGEGSRDSGCDHFYSDQSEFWVTYLKDIPKLKAMLKNS